MLSTEQQKQAQEIAEVAKDMATMNGDYERGDATVQVRQLRRLTPSVRDEAIRLLNGA